MPLLIPWEFVIKPAEGDRTKLNAALNDLNAVLPNGKLHLAMTLPALPELHVKGIPQVLFGDVDGLHLVALVGEGSLLPSQDPQTSNEPVPADFEEILKEYRLPAGKDFRVRLPSKPILEAITALNSLPVADRTVQLSGRPEKHILDRKWLQLVVRGHSNWKGSDF